MWQTFAEKLLCYSLLKKAPVLSLKGRYLFWKALDLLKKRPCLLRWNSGSFGHDFTYVRIHSPVRMCGSLRDVRKKACFLVRDKTQCAQIYCKMMWRITKKKFMGTKMGIIFYSIYNSVSLPCFPCWYFRKGGMGEWKIHIYRKDVYLAFCSWHFETSQISNPATNKATVGVCAIC